MARTHLNGATSAAGRMTEIVTKAGREDKDSDVLMRTKIVEDKSGQLKDLFRGITTSSFGAKLKNWLLGRSPANDKHVISIFKNAGMSDAQAREALFRNVNHVGAHYSAKSVKTEVSKFHAAQHQEKIAKKNFSAEDGKLLTKNLIDFYEADLKFALDYPIKNYKD